MIGMRSRAVRLAPAWLALIAALALASCGLFPDDSFPDWLPYVEGVEDIAGLSAGLGLGDFKEAARLEYAAWQGSDGGDLSKVLFYAYYDSGEALLALEPGSLELAASWRRIDPGLGVINRVVKATVGGFISGGLEFDPEDLSAAPTALPGTPSADARVFTAGEPERNYIVYIAGGTIGELSIASYDGSYGDAVSSTRTLDSAGSYIRIVDAEYVAGKFRILAYAAPFGSSMYSGYVFSFDDEAALLSAEPLLGDDGAPAAGIELTGPFPLRDEGGWLTEDGVVALVDDSSTFLRRYAYGSVASASDELSLGNDTEDQRALSFDPSGERWYLLDGWAGRLYEMRAWW